MGHDQIKWNLKLFSKSVLKQAKWAQLKRMLGGPPKVRGLDLGADNGVISFLLRRQGGAWCSGDLDPHAVDSIRSLVGDGVYQIDSRELPFPEAHFDVVVVIDMFEHLHDDALLAGEIHRVLCPEGRLIVNVPHRKRLPLLRPLRLALGLTDQWHGHVRPGYSLDDLKGLLGDGFEIRSWRTYNRFFSELLDIVLNYAYLRKSRVRGPQTVKGTIITDGDLERHERAFRLYSRLFPVMRLISMLDVLMRPFSGYSLIVSARRRGSSPPTV